MPLGVGNTIADYFGSRRGLLNYSKYYVQHLLGGYRPYGNVQWERVERFVFICKGNICRSPLGWAYAQQQGIATDSFGLECRDGQPADPRAIEFAAGLGIDLSAHRTRNIGQLQPRAGDLLVAMEPLHLPPLAAHGRIAQITLAGLWMPRATPYLHDPYSANSRYFERCETNVVAAVDRMLQLRGR